MRQCKPSLAYDTKRTMLWVDPFREISLIGELNSDCLISGFEFQWLCHRLVNRANAPKIALFS